MAATFERSLHLPVSRQEAFAWHEKEGALDRLIPPWEDVAIVKRGDGICDGSVVELLQKLGPLKLKWIARHHDVIPGQRFRDSQVVGPFSRWEHEHKFHSQNGNADLLTDSIEYKVPGGIVGTTLGGRLVRSKIESMFAYRHKTTYDDLFAHAQHKDRGSMSIAVTGASGLVGSTLVPMLTTGGHKVVRVVRRKADLDEITWDPAAETFDASALDGSQAVVHLAGENIAGARWSKKVKENIRKSRVHATRVLCEGLAKMKSPPRVLVCASAIGYYGDRGNEVLTEQSEVGAGFLAKVSEQWEEATKAARDAGIRVVNLRFGVILSPKGGALSKMLLPFKLGGGGRVASGRQFWSWISIDDAAGAIHHALMTDSLAGPVNAVAPNPVTNLEFTKTLGRVLRRPTFAPLPAIAARVVLGEMADELLISSIRVEPQKLNQSGYHFRQPKLELALRHLLGKSVPSPS